MSRSISSSLRDYSIPRHMNARRAPSTLQGSRFPTVLLVDDDPAVREGLRRVLVSQPLHVIVAASGGEAVRLMENQVPDLLITDLCMPHASGWELIEHEAHRRPDLPIFVVTALPAKEARHVHQVATEFFQKPLDLEALLSAIRYHLCIGDSEPSLPGETFSR